MTEFNAPMMFSLDSTAYALIVKGLMKLPAEESYGLLQSLQNGVNQELSRRQAEAAAPLGVEAPVPAVKQRGKKQR